MPGFRGEERGWPQSSFVTQGQYSPRKEGAGRRRKEKEGEGGHADDGTEAARAGYLEAFVRVRAASARPRF